MKKLLISLLATALVFFTLVFSLGSIAINKTDDFMVAMVTDFSDVNDASFNQACYEGAKEWGKGKTNVTFNYFKPSDVSHAERIKSINLAIDRGYKVILCPGFALGPAIAEVAPKYPDVKFIGLDIAPGDFPTGFELTKNIAVYNYREEIGGYLAGYAAVKEGFTKLGYLGGIPASAVVRFGYGYVQGIDAAAKELDTRVSVKYAYAGQFFGDNDIFKQIDNWYKTNETDIVFSCGGSIYTSVALAAKENNGYMIGVDNDQAPIIDRDYKEGICITSAMKGIKQTVIDKLELLYSENKFEPGFTDLGIESVDHPELNYVQLPLDNWRMKNFAIQDYKNLLSEIYSGSRAISNDSDSSKHPRQIDFTNVDLDYKEGTIK